MRGEPFAAGDLAGWVTGDGPRVLLLHGGPGLSFDYLDALADDLGTGFRLAAFQQRGLTPSTVAGPFDLATAVGDAVAVLDALGWDRAWIAGHSWGGRLAAYLLADAPARFEGALVIDTLGAVGDGGYERFVEVMEARTPPADRERAEALDERATRGGGTPEDALESLRLYWPAYFPTRDRVPPMPPLRIAVDAHSALLDATLADPPDVGRIRGTFGAIAGGRSPMPHEHAAAPTVAAIPGAWLDVVPDAGHFIWHDAPGSVRAALTRLVTTRA